jgi:predicted nucleic acid-binding protein
MKIAITDACIFIDLIELQLTSQFFGLDIEIHTTLDVYNELYIEQQEWLKVYRSFGKLTIHNLSPEEKDSIQNRSFPKSLSDNDKSVLFLAEKLDALILSSDKAVRNFAKKHSIEYHGMLWIFDCLIEKGLISKEEAILKLRSLISNNIVYQNNMELNAEIEKRVKKWSS